MQVRQCFLACLLGLLAAATASQATAQVAGWQPGFGPADFQVEAIVYWQGDLIAAGTFTMADGAPANHVARWDGAAWQPLGTGMDLPVHALTVFGGDLVAGGEFTIADGHPAARVARWNGTTWQAMGGTFASQRGVWAFATYASELIAAGSIINEDFVARFTGSIWQSLGNPTIRPMVEMTLHGGDLIVGGVLLISGSNTNLLMRWDHSTWTDMSAGLNGSIGGLVSWNGQLVAGGEFTAANSGPVNHVAFWNGTGWSQLGSGLDGNVHCLAVAPDGRLVAGGDFVQAGGAAVSHLAVWDGNSWSELGDGTDNAVLAFAVQGSELAVGGRFTSAGATSGSALALWDGLYWTGIAGLAGGKGLQGAGVFGPTFALTYFRGDLIAAGGITSAGGVAVNNIARWDGTSWHPLLNGLNGDVYALFVHNDRLIAGGYFTMAGNVAVNRVASWDGAAWAPLGAGFDRVVRALTVFAGDLVAGGDFTDSGGTLAMKVARWNGTSWVGMGSGFDNSVYSLAPDGTGLVAGGVFGYAGIPLNQSLARWNGAAWENVGSGHGAGVVRAVASLNGEILAGSPLGLKRWNGVSWSVPGAGVSGPVFALTPTSTGVLVGGTFLNAGGMIANNIAHYDGAWTVFAPGTSNAPLETPTVQAIAAREREFFVYGKLWTAGIYAASGIARWWEPRTSDVASTLPGGARLSHWPNPFNPATTIRFDPQHTGPITLAIYDIRGGLVRTLVQRSVPGTPQQVIWDGTDAGGRPSPSGIYVLRLDNTAGTASRKLTLLR